MKKPSSILIEKYEILKEVFDKYNVREIRIFGSIARMEDREDSDIDFLIDFPTEGTIFDLASLHYELSQTLEHEFDLLTYKGLNERVLESFIKNSIELTELPHLTPSKAIQNQFTNTNRLLKNLNGLLWTINRIELCMNNITQERFLSDEGIQDATTRNIQLMGQIITQISEEDLSKLKEDGLQLEHITVLRDSLFMNVDLHLLWNTLVNDIPLYKEKISDLLIRK